MPALRSAGFVIFRTTSRGKRYLVLRASRNKSLIAKGKVVREFWDLPKGTLEKGETGMQAAMRETREEAGIHTIRVIDGFKETARYFTWKDGKRTLKFVAMFLAETTKEKVTLSWEHDRYEWLPYNAAYERVTLKPMKEVLRGAEKLLGEYS
ncbi:MAG: Bis(5'-nucleosyl)-tetraphosphatase [asymmetrical] (Diadenosine 5',5'''-P1,P4-tetraphosphate asymmetrical hydrolase) (Diadenosine tetraphosphatase) (Ap4A hydrolase) (Ap4Aase) (Nucleoside diphosphate-linked moiety X motif 2) (Nudix motif 2) [Parcubacteria group bacterium Greene0714_36]|nr:MAG: Bis(5'-nucleosyl)-tetraphosphatase [asymmetrical] (Diadenosine 5',5'''-P1,P4-tetraphosphate asymmetrical hydrolase) (Diadenosine tetraphosphatase) (Ap4A hydrolase) (Ap4Aase) (Nucleoside diphosphate-linked moiety X motif 2) (Nudix motif 2) [Parcubacteria group bacterium Greene0714_36]